MSAEQDEHFKAVLLEILAKTGNHPGDYVMIARATVDVSGSWWFTWEWYWKQGLDIAEAMPDGVHKAPPGASPSGP